MAWWRLGVKWPSCFQRGAPDDRWPDRQCRGRLPLDFLVAHAIDRNSRPLFYLICHHYLPCTLFINVKVESCRGERLGLSSTTGVGEDQQVGGRRRGLSHPGKDVDCIGTHITDISE
jgi:hypothetical protein